MTSREYIYELIEPRNDRFISRLYDYVMLVAIVIGIVPLLFREQPRIFWYFDLISGMCFVIDYLLRWITADLSSKQNKIRAFFDLSIYSNGYY